MSKKDIENEKVSEVVSDKGTVIDEQGVDKCLSESRNRVSAGLSIFGLMCIIAISFLSVFLICSSIRNSNTDDVSSSQIVTSARGLLIEVPNDWGVTNYWGYSQVALTPKSENEESKSESSSSNSDLFEGIMITTGYLNEKTDLTSFTDEIYKAVQNTSNVDTSMVGSKISNNDVKFISMTMDNAYAGMYYMFHDNLAIEIVCSAKSEARLKEYKKDAEDLISKFKYTNVSASDFDTIESENSTVSGKVESVNSETESKNEESSTSESK